MLYVTAAMTVAPSKLRFALMQEGDRLPAWAKRCLDRTIDSGRAELVLSIREVREPRATKSALGGFLYRAYAEHWLARRSAALRLDTGEPVVALTQLECRVSEPAQTLSDADVQRLQAHDLDFILRFGHRPIAGAVLEVARFGLWSFRHERHAAPFFAEVLSGAYRTETELERLPSQNWGRVSLFRGSFGTCRASWLNNTERALAGSADFCARACAKVAQRATLDAGSLPSDAAHAGARVLQLEPEDSDLGVGRDRDPSNRDLVALLARSGAHAAHKLWELLFHVELWNVGFTRQTLAEQLRVPGLRADGMRWCKPHRAGRFIADPSVHSTPAGEQLLVEEYGPEGKGRLCRVLESADSQLQLEVAFEAPYHLSNPCIFREAGRTYCVPEAYQSGRVSLYELIEGRFHLVRELLEGAPFVDPTLFEHAGLYWILCTLQNDGAWGNQRLCAYYAERLDGIFKPHLLNPVKCDIGSSRPAGSPVRIDGKLYRPSQDCSRTYGGAVVVNEITKLSPTEFEEIEVARIEPMRNSPYPDGLHTLNVTEQGLVIDAKRFVFDVLAWRQNWRRLYEVFR